MGIRIYDSNVQRAYSLSDSRGIYSRKSRSTRVYPRAPYEEQQTLHVKLTLNISIRMILWHIVDLNHYTIHNSNNDDTEKILPVDDVISCFYHPLLVIEAV